MIKIAINGYGRIGRIAHRVIIERFSDQVEVVALNAGSSTDLKGWMYLLQFDSVYGPLDIENLSIKTPEEAPLSFQTQAPFLGMISVNGKDIPVFSEKDPANLPWKDLNVDVVIESTGAFTTQEKMQPHLTAGAKAAILSAPFKDEASGATYVLGVNLDKNSSPSENLISNASCTTNCVAPVARIIQDAFGIEKAMMTTIHGYTSDQRLQDGGHKDYRRARAAGVNLIPTSTGATIAAAQAIPELKGIFNGMAIRAPVPVGSLSDFTFLVKKETTVEEINQVLEKASQEEKYQGILTVTKDPIVSSDIIGDSHSSIVDLSLTQVVGGNMVKIVAWYDNEYGYSNRLVEEAIILGRNSQNAAQTV